MPRPARQPDPTPDEIAARAALVRADSLARKRAQLTDQASLQMYEHQRLRHPRKHRLVIAKKRDRM